MVLILKRKVICSNNAVNDQSQVDDSYPIMVLRHAICRPLPVMTARCRPCMHEQLLLTEGRCTSHKLRVTQSLTYSPTLISGETRRSCLTPAQSITCKNTFGKKYRPSSVSSRQSTLNGAASASYNKHTHNLV